MKQITLTGLVDFVTAGAAKQRRIVRDFKYPKDDEPRAKIGYYRDARDLIRSMHEAHRGSDWLIARAGQLEGLGQTLTGWHRSRLLSNVRALTDYAGHFGDRELELLPRRTFEMHFGDVRVTVTPHLHGREGKTEKIIRLDFSGDGLAPNRVKPLCQVLFEAAHRSGLQLPSASVVLWELSTGKEHQGARLGSRMAKDIEAACQNISAIWDQLK